jgi:hypothetical protein
MLRAVWLARVEGKLNKASEGIAANLHGSESEMESQLTCSPVSVCG